MGNVYEGGDADKRQGGDIVPTLFRPRYRKLDEDEIALHDEIKAKAEELLALYDKIPKRGARAGDGVTLSESLASNTAAHVILAARHLEDSVYRAVKALTA